MFQVVFDGHQPENPGDFISVERTVDEVAEYLKNRGISRLDAAYGCSLGGVCLTRFLTHYFPRIGLREIPNMAHAELEIVRQEKFSCMRRNF